MDIYAQYFLNYSPKLENLDPSPPKPQNIEVEAAGKDAGGTLRHQLVERREAARGRLLNKALDNYGDRGARPVRSWRERDKHSTAWLLCFPGLDTSLSNAH